jgi:hypothetical protein
LPKIDIFLSLSPTHIEMQMKFVAKEHIKNGVNNSEPKEIVIEPDGPSTVSKEDEESKVSVIN